MINIYTFPHIINFSTTQDLLDTLLPPLDENNDPIAYSDEEKWRVIRIARDALLTQSDWTMLPDSCNKTFKDSCVTYRQTLRDITTAYSTPESVVFPEFPSGSSARAVPYVLPPSYTVTNLTDDRTYNADATQVNKLADVLGTIIKDQELL